MKSVMKHQFSQVPKAQIQRSKFNRSHGLKTTFDGGYLVPIFVDEVLPGDTFNLSMTGFARMATPIFPIMDNLFMETFFFFVPNRLVWDNWQRFCGEQDNPTDSTDYAIPSLSNGNGLYVGSLADYMGLPIPNDPVDPAALVDFSLLPFRCYNLIYNEWFRDQNLQDQVLEDKGDDYSPIVDFVNDYQLLRRGKRHDYFTSCLPFPQKGENVTIGLTGDVPVSGIGVLPPSGPTVAGVQESDGTTGSYVNAWELNDAVQRAFIEENPDNAGFPNIFASLSEASAISINDLREAFQIQRLLERDARGGTRYIELIKSHFGVTSPDARLQRPEYLGGGSTPITISPIASTFPTVEATGNIPQANLAAVGTASMRGHGFSKSFTEHGHIIGLINVRADLTYQQGLNRMWSRRTRYDYYWPALAHLGEQAVLSKEIYCDASPDDELVFGYQERYAEYRYKPSMITGVFRSVSAQSLDAWHLSQEFANRPQLNEEFIVDEPPIDRVVAVPSEPDFIFDGYFKLNCARPMPLYGVPGLIDHF